MPNDQLEAARLISLLRLEEHPEGGWYRQSFVDQPDPASRAFSTAIYYLLEQGQNSHWHRVDASEVWHFYAGAPLQLMISDDGKSTRSSVLGVDFLAGQRPQIVVASGHWQSAKSLGDWSLVGCTVAPGFEFSGFEMAPKNWTPG